jgi:hypothetical protein
VAQDLLPAIEAVRRGEEFVSTGLLRDDVPEARDMQAANRVSQQSADD